MRRRSIQSSATFALLLGLLAVSSALAASGRVVDPEGKPLEGARVCHVSRGEYLDCVETDAEGFYSLPESPVREVRIRFPGYLIERVDAGPLDQPVRLRRAATLEVKFVVAPDGRPVDGISFFLLRHDGSRQGPMGPTNLSGTIIVDTLASGSATLSVYAPGFVKVPGRNVVLKGGERTRLTIQLERERESALSPGS